MRHVFGQQALRSIVFAAVLVAAPSVSVAQSSPPPAMSHEEIMSLAKVFVALADVHDSIDAKLAQPRNKTLDAQQQLRDLQVTQRGAILGRAGMSPQDYEHKLYILSSDEATRKMFDAMVAQITGVPTPGQAPPSAPAAPPAVTNLPAGAVGTHIGHVVNAFGDTPKGAGLLPTAMAEARTASQHAVLASKDPANLASMQLHAGHVINALDPSIVATGPGLGYGVKKAATGVATHIELAAKAPGASQNVITHSVHIATSARNTVERADQIIALCQQVRAATSAADAAPLISQIVSLSDQLIKGADANADGKITWEKGEGGLQQAQEHINLMLAAEKPSLR